MTEDKTKEIINYLNEQFENKKGISVNSKKLVDINILTVFEHCDFYNDLIKIPGKIWNGIRYKTPDKNIFFINPQDDDGGIGERERKRKEPTKGHERT
jgi:hypothetical protein